MKKRTQFIIIAAVIMAAAGYMIAQQMQSATISSQEAYKALNDTSFVLMDVGSFPEHLRERIK